MTCDQPQPVRPPREIFLLSIRDARRALRTIASRAASVATSNGIFTEAARRYLQPLIRGEAYPPYGRNGLPKYLQLHFE